MPRFGRPSSSGHGTPREVLVNPRTRRVPREAPQLLPRARADVAGPLLRSLDVSDQHGLEEAFAYAELRDALEKLGRCRVVMSPVDSQDTVLPGTDADRSSRNCFQVRWLATACSASLEAKAEIRALPGPIPQSTLCVGNTHSNLDRVITGTCSLTTHGLGLAPSSGLSKGSLFANDLRHADKVKMDRGRAHFNALEVHEADPYEAVRSLDGLLERSAS